MPLGRVSMQSFSNPLPLTLDTVLSETAVAPVGSRTDNLDTARATGDGLLRTRLLGGWPVVRVGHTATALES